MATILFWIVEALQSLGLWIISSLQTILLWGITTVKNIALSLLTIYFCVLFIGSLIYVILHIRELISLVINFVIISFGVIFNLIVVAILAISKTDKIAERLLITISLIISCLIFFIGFIHLSFSPLWVGLFSLFSFLIVYVIFRGNYKGILEDLSIRHLINDEEFPQKFKRERVTHLTLAYCEISKIGPKIGQYINLKKLEIEGNIMTELPPEIGSLTKLEVLDIIWTGLMSLPPEIEKLTKLKELNIIANKLMYLPPEIGNLTNIKILNLSGNKLTSLPPEIGKLTNLTTLNLGINRFKELPREVGYLNNLASLDISENPLTSLPVEIADSHFLSLDIYISHEQLAPLFADLQQIKKISLYVDDVRLRPKYMKCHPSQWSAEWLLSEKNAAQRRLLIQVIGYDRICQELGAIELDAWQEYTLLEINDRVDVEKICLLKMICPSTGSVYIVRVPPDIESAREAIKWANWGIDPEEFSVQT